MTDLLTTKQVQELLRVNRTTIYRMVESGQLPALRVGKQWRFVREQVEGWLRSGSLGEVPGVVALGSDAVPNTALPATVTPNEAPWTDRSDLAALLAMPCTQLIQDTFAEMLSVMMVITDMEGQPVTRISNPSGFFTALTAGGTGAVSQCVARWQQFANEPTLEPKWMLNEMGLLCARALIRVGLELKGMVVLGGIAPEGWPPPNEQVAALARQFSVEPPAILARVEAVHRLDEPGRDRALRSVQRIADLFAHLIQEHGTWQDQLDALTAQIERRR